MQKKIIISANTEQTCVALCENGLLVEYTMEGRYAESLVGCIFKGQVKQVKQGINAAFLDIGIGKNVFMTVDAETPVTEGQLVLVQVVKDATGDKGAVVSRKISLAGRYVVLMPLVNYIGVSKNITDKEKRQELENLAREARSVDIGLIMRTNCQEATAEEITFDIKQAIALWQGIQAKFKILVTGSILYRELSLPVRIIRDYLQADVTEVIVDNEPIYKIIQELATDIDKQLLDKVKLYRNSLDIFKFYALNQEIAGILNRRIDLANGSYLIFDYTEALTVIDVNSGKFTGQNKMGDSYLQANVLAAQEIARQIRLRDITGIIIVDFIDMQKEKEREQIAIILKSMFANDRRKPKVIGFTELGLMQITRKKMRKNMYHLLMSDCNYCHGSGKLKSVENVSLEIYRSLLSLSKEKLGSRTVLLQVHPLLAQYFSKKYLPNLQHNLNLKIKIKAVEGMHRELFSILMDKE